jgi:LacI family transcriptional regulator
MRRGVVFRHCARPGDNSLSKVTIADVAHRAGVSAGTVSHVLSGEAKVSQRLRDRVMHAIEDMGYVPNYYAQGLRKATSKVVGLCLPHTVTSYVAGLSATLDELTTASGYGLLNVASREVPQTELARVQQLLQFRVAGILLFPNSSPDGARDFLFERKFPVVLLDRSNDDMRFDQVVLNNRLAMRQVVLDLFNLGHRSFLVVCRSRKNLTTKHRIEGFTLAQEMVGETIQLNFVEFHDNEDELRDKLVAEYGRKSAPTAIISSSSQQTALTISILRGIDIEFPRDVSLVTFDDAEWSKLVTPPLSVIRQPTRRVAEEAWALLQRRLDDPDAPLKQIELEAEVELRGSVGPAPYKAGTGGAKRLKSAKQA